MRAVSLFPLCMSRLCVCVVVVGVCVCVWGGN